MNSFLTELTPMLKNFPDYNEEETVDEIRHKSTVLHLGLDFGRLDDEADVNMVERKKPLIIWNHRWEYDKNPADFFNALCILSDRGLDFDLAVLGENFRKEPLEFDEAKKKLVKHIVHFGYAKNFSSYASWLWRADIMPVTCRQDFFGGSVVEGIYCNTYPLLPERLAYPEHLPKEKHAEFFYHDFDDLLKRLESAVRNVDRLRKEDVSSHVRRYGWHTMANEYDDLFAGIVSSNK